jgi:hypothetical protein
LILQSSAGGDNPTAEVVQFGWAFGQESFNLDSPLGNFVVYALNVCRVDAPARVEFKSCLQRLSPGDELYDQEMPEAGNRFEC